MNVQATELKKRLGKYLDAAIKEPVVVETSGRNTTVTCEIRGFPQERHGSSEHRHLLDDSRKARA